MAPTTTDSPAHRPSVAVIGGGIAGLGAAVALVPDCAVTVYEASAWLGGHANTREFATGDGRRIPVDTGFIVYNERTYPELVALFDRLDVPTQASDMSMSISCAGCGLEYAGRRPVSLLLAALRRPFSTLPLLLEVRRFLRTGNAYVRELAQHGTSGDLPLETLREWSVRHGFSERVRSHFVVPLTAAVWSTPPGEALDLPAASTLLFLRNHGMLEGPQLQWRTVTGGSREYVRRVVAHLESGGAHLRTSAPVTCVRTLTDGVELELATGEVLSHDYVVVAAHADDALAVLDEPTDLERAALRPWSYTDNHVVLHSDRTFLPRMRAAVASWNYHLADCAAGCGPPTLTYSMNHLQALPTTDTCCVTMNPGSRLDPTSVQFEAHYRHPSYTEQAVRAQRLLPRLLAGAAAQRRAFCGAYHGYGFHEDGLRSGLAAGHRIRELACAGRRAPEPELLA